jgi:hypothetical protein
MKNEIPYKNEVHYKGCRAHYGFNISFDMDDSVKPAISKHIIESLDFLIKKAVKNLRDDCKFWKIPVANIKVE